MRKTALLVLSVAVSGCAYGTDSTDTSPVHDEAVADGGNSEDTKVALNSTEQATQSHVEGMVSCVQPTQEVAPDEHVGEAAEPLPHDICEGALAIALQRCEKLSNPASRSTCSAMAWVGFLACVAAEPGG